MRRILGTIIALVSAAVIAAPVAQASTHSPQQQTQTQATVVDGGATIQGWAYICRRYETVGVRHWPGAPAYVQLHGGTAIYVDDYRDRVWVHITTPYSGYILYSTVCQ